jgi:dihydroanticapsin dehydrogenase
MIQNGGGVIVGTASTSGLVGQRGTGIYNASKAADIALIRNIALDYAPDNIRANCICPAYIDDTKINKEIFEKARQEGGPWEDILKLHPIGRIGQPEDIAKCALFLASEDSSFATGAHFVVDGGYTAI